MPQTSTTVDNRSIATDFLADAAMGHAGEAMARLGAPDFVHHNPALESDAETLTSAMDQDYREFPDREFEIVRTIAEGPCVAVHSRIRRAPNEEPIAVVHILRIEDGRIRELWDVAQVVPAVSPNTAGML